MTQTTPSHSQAVEAEPIAIVNKATCISVHRGNEVLANFAGPESHANARLFAAALTSQQEVAAPVSDERADEIANACYHELLVTTAYNGGMGGLTWDRALVRAAMAARTAPAGTVPLSQGKQPLTDDQIDEIADSDECSPDDRGWGPKFSKRVFARAVLAAQEKQDQGHLAAADSGGVQEHTSREWDHVDDVLAVIERMRSGEWYWGSNSRCKYIELRIDTRDGGCILRDRESVRISPAQLAKQLNGYGPMPPWERANPATEQGRAVDVGAKS